MVWRDVNTLHKITEIEINSFERNLWNVMRHLQDSKFGLGSFLHSLYEGKCGRKSCELSMFYNPFMWTMCGHGFGFSKNGQQTLSSLFLR